MFCFVLVLFFEGSHIIFGLFCYVFLVFFLGVGEQLIPPPQKKVFFVYFSMFPFFP